MSKLIRRRQHGYNMIELMVSITISLFILAGLAGILFSMKSSLGAQNGLTQIQEAQRFMLTSLNTVVHNAGYYSDTLNTTLPGSLPAPATANPDGTTFAAGQFITGTTGGMGNSDTINVRFQTAPNDGLINCIGDTNTTTGAVVYANSFAVNAAGQMTCAVSVNGGAFSAPAVLIDNISSMKMVFGTDTGTDGNIDAYQTASTVSSAAAWQKVGSVKFLFSFKDLVKSTPQVPVDMPNPVLHAINLMNKQ